MVVFVGGGVAPTSSFSPPCFEEGRSCVFVLTERLPSEEGPFFEGFGAILFLSILFWEAGWAGEGLGFFKTMLVGLTPGEKKESVLLAPSSRGDGWLILSSVSGRVTFSKIKDEPRSAEGLTEGGPVVLKDNSSSGSKAGVVAGMIPTSVATEVVEVGKEREEVEVVLVVIWRDKDSKATAKVFVLTWVSL